jgi:threonine synthase
VELRVNYFSTRGQITPVGFADAVMMGLADDGGLLLPESVPDVADRLEQWRSLDYPALAFEVLLLFVGDDIPPDHLRDLVDRSYATFNHRDIAPVVPVGDLFVLELFHGPTLAFKDFALQLLGNLFEYILAQRQERLNILGATSGDTGSAAIAGVRGKDNINIFIMHPHNRVSPVQERQMTSVLDDNVHNIAIEGTFDDAQDIMKRLFADLDFKQKYNLGAVNSVNWARVAAQIVYYFWGVFRVQDKTGADTVQCSIPTGNFGDIFAGYIAKKMGAPIASLILATNANDILSRFFSTGVYSRSTVVPTPSPSMDIQVASNFERYLYYAVDEDCERLRAIMTQFADSAKIELPPGADGRVDPAFRAGACDTDATLARIRSCYESAQYILDPHTAVGVDVACRVREDNPVLCLATAHPAKFGAAVEQALGHNPATHPAIEALADLPTRCTTLPATIPAIRDYMTALIS